MKNNVSFRTAALITVVAYLMMFGAPFAQFYVLQKLVIPDNIAGTAKNILDNLALFRLGIFGYLLNFIGDLIAAWSLYILLKPVNENLSMLAAWFRLAYTIISLTAVINLFTVTQFLTTEVYLKNYTTDQLYFNVSNAINIFRNGWTIAYPLFGIHLLLLGYLIIKSEYIPGYIGIGLLISGSGWIVDNIRPLLFPGVHIDFKIIAIAGLGELVLFIWLLLRGRKLPAY